MWIFLGYSVLWFPQLKWGMSIKQETHIKNLEVKTVTGTSLLLNNISHYYLSILLKISITKRAKLSKHIHLYAFLLSLSGKEIITSVNDDHN